MSEIRESSADESAITPAGEKKNQPKPAILTNMVFLSELGITGRSVPLNFTPRCNLLLFA
jgi:hypothetical protein